MYALHVYEGGGSTTARLIISSSLAALKAVRVPRLELLGALIGLRQDTFAHHTRCLHNKRPLGWTIWTWGTRSKDKVENKNPS